MHVLGNLGNLCYWHLMMSMTLRQFSVDVICRQYISFVIASKNNWNYKVPCRKYFAVKIIFWHINKESNAGWKSLYVLCTSQNSKIHLTQSAIKLVKWFVDILLKNRSKKDQVWFFASESSTHPIPNKNGNSLSKVRRIDQVHSVQIDAILAPS